jgi:Mg-chelatase subunit ChlD
MPLNRRCLALVVAIIVLAPPTLSAQRTNRLVFVRATDAAGAPMLNLASADLRVTENGAPREVTRVSRGTAPLRIVLLVDSSTSMDPMMSTFRDALNGFVDAVPPEHEIAFISTGGQLRVRTPPTRDRQLLKTEITRFASGGGANAFLDSMIEADRRFLASAPGQWPVIVIVTTDKGENRREFDLNRYNIFMNGFVARGGAAHAIIVRGQEVGPVTDLAQNLVENTRGMHGAINTHTTLPEQLAAIAERVTADHRRMADTFEVEFIGDARQVQPIVNVILTRQGGQVEMAARRPF